MLAAALLLMGAAGAQPSGPKFLKAAASAPKSVQAGKPFVVSVSVTVDSPYHVQANPSKEGYIATELDMGSVKGLKLEKVVYPKGTEAVISGDRLPVYKGKVTIRAEVSTERGAAPGKVALPLTLKFQGCDDQKCFPPTTISIKSAVVLTPGAK
jgi:hypothetical protein